MKYQLPPDGLHRETHANGTPSAEYTLKNGERHGLFRRWHENGQLSEECLFEAGLAEGEWRHWNSRGELLGTDLLKGGTGITRQWHSNGQVSGEVSYFRGQMTGRMRCWAEDGMLYGTSFFSGSCPISKKRYLELCNENPALPRFADEKVANTFGNYVRRLRREKREKAKLGPTEEQIAAEVRFDQVCAAEVKSADSAEVVSWIEKGKRGQRELGELERGQALKLARKLYALGSVKVWATRIERDEDGFECSNRLIVKLPHDAGERSKIYNLCSDPARPFLTNGMPAICVGRQYMSVSLL